MRSSGWPRSWLRSVWCGYCEQSGERPASPRHHRYAARHSIRSSAGGTTPRPRRTSRRCWRRGARSARRWCTSGTSRGRAGRCSGPACRRGVPGGAGAARRRAAAQKNVPDAFVHTGLERWLHVRGIRLGRDRRGDHEQFVEATARIMGTSGSRPWWLRRRGVHVRQAGHAGRAAHGRGRARDARWRTSTASTRRSRRPRSCWCGSPRRMSPRTRTSRDRDAGAPRRWRPG